jgi:Mce-associated membrane protein
MADDEAAPIGEKGEPAPDASDSAATQVAEVKDVETSPVVDEASPADDEIGDVEGDDAEDYDAEDIEDGENLAAMKAPMSHVRLATIVGLVAVLALAGLVGWLGFRTYQSHQADTQRKEFLAVGRQGALNLTTIDFEHVDADVKRILDSATGTFYDDFSQRSGPFVQVVKEVKSKSVGSVTEAGVESVSADAAQVLVAVSVNTSVVGQPDQRPRSWRMRILLQKVGDEPKVSNVEFVP